MIPSDLRNLTWEQLQPYLVSARLEVLGAWRRYTRQRAYTTAVVAEMAEMNILTFRPRTTELVQLGLVKLVSRQGAEGTYQAVPYEQAQAAYEAHRAANTPRAEQMPLL